MTTMQLIALVLLSISINPVLYFNDKFQENTRTLTEMVRNKNSMDIINEQVKKLDKIKVKFYTALSIQIILMVIVFVWILWNLLT